MLQFYSIPASEKTAVKIYEFLLEGEAASAAAKSVMGMGMLDLEAVRESLPEEAVLSSGAVELMRQMKQQQEANASAGGNLLGNVGSTMAMASIMQLMTSRKPAPAPVSAPVSTPAPAPAPVKIADTAKREPGSGTAANGAAQGTETERFLSFFLWRYYLLRRKLFHTDCFKLWPKG